MPLLVTRVGDAYDRHCAYVYLLATRAHAAVYVGETNDVGGTIGRAGNHLRPAGTFTTRFEEKKGLSAEMATDLTLFSARLPQTPEFLGVERTYRQAVEYLVHTKLLMHPARLVYRFDLIADIRAGTTRASETQVISIAEGIVQEFIARYPTLA